MIFASKPQHVDAVQWTGDNFEEVASALPGKVNTDLSGLKLLAGKDGAQEWVPVPNGHWLVHQPGDLSDVWPVDPDYFAKKYDPADACNDAAKRRIQRACRSAHPT